MRLKRLKDRRKQSFIEGIDPTLIDSEVDKIERAERIEYCDPRFHALNYGRSKRPKSSTVTSPKQISQPIDSEGFIKCYLTAESSTDDLSLKHVWTRLPKLHYADDQGTLLKLNDSNSR